MNDKAVNVLEQYDMTVNRTFKGRGTIICDTDQGMRVLKEYRGRTEKLELLFQLQGKLKDSLRTDTLIRTKEGALFVKDLDNSVYILEEQVEGKECTYKNEEDIVKACGAMAKLHLKFMTPQSEKICVMPVFFYADEMERHTIECKRVRNYLRKLHNKTEFERALLKEYDYFLEKAVAVTRRAREESQAEYEAYVNSNGLYCHGDYQYHNVIFGKGSGGAYTGIVNLEQFWKIINFYYNSRKSWMPNRNYDKLESLIRQEKNREKLLNKFFS